MSNDIPQTVNLSEVGPGKLVRIVNRSASAKKYTFNNGAYGELSFTLIVGAECQFIVGTVAPEIVMHDVDPIDIDNDEISLI